MAIIITCDQCGKRMGSLEPHKIKDNKYLCCKCAEEEVKEDPILLFYNNVAIRNLNDFSS